jgi:hypothetical protein
MPAGVRLVDSIDRRGRRRETGPSVRIAPGDCICAAIVDGFELLIDSRHGCGN